MRKTPLSLAIGVALAAALLATSAARAQSSGQGNLKAAIVYNILRFVDFPVSSGRVLNLCVKRGAGGESLTALSGRTVGAKSISVRAIDVDRGGGDCDVVYLGFSNAAEVSRLKQRGLLTIGDGSGFLKAGGAVGLVTTGKQIRFEVSVRSARQSGITISSQLLRLASRVEQ